MFIRLYSLSTNQLRIQEKSVIKLSEDIDYGK